MKDVILKQLKDIEQKYNIVILLAVDGGSRGYGIAAPDSDHDVRFIYVRSRVDYLRVVNRLPDTISEKHFDVLDFHGWDLSKVAEQAAAGNVKLWDMLMAKDAFIRNQQFVEDTLNFTRCFHNPRLVHAYIRRSEEYLDKHKDEKSIPAKAALHAAVAAMQAHFFISTGKIPPCNLPDLYWQDTPQFLSLMKTVALGRATGTLISVDHTFSDSLRSFLLELHCTANRLTNPNVLRTEEVMAAVNNFFVSQLQWFEMLAEEANVIRHKKETQV